MSSEIKDFREAVKNRLVAEVAELQADEVIVHRRGDLFSKIGLVATKSKNQLAVTIGPARGRNNSREGEELDFDVTLRIEIWFFPLLAGQASTVNEEELTREIMRKLNGDWPEGIYEHEVVRVTSFGDLPDTEANLTYIDITRSISIDES